MNIFSLEELVAFSFGMVVGASLMFLIYAAA